VKQTDESQPPPSLRVAARSVYGTDATGYAAGRPDYPPPVYETLRRRCGLTAGAVVLEIGAGAGLVTRTLLSSGARVVAVEPDLGMAEYLLRRVGGCLEVVVETFERATLGPWQFDLVVAATSFHWVDQSLGLPKLGQAVRPGGWVALWWTIFNDPGAEDPFRDALEARLGRQDPGGQRKVDFQLDVASRTTDLREVVGLELVGSETTRWTVELSSSRLRDLYASLIAVRRLPPRERQALLDHVSQLADEDFGGRVRRPFVTIMYTGRRPNTPETEPSD
jgi:hypothetical protein